jgi:hypothetical protein
MKVVKNTKLDYYYEFHFGWKHQDGADTRSYTAGSTAARNNHGYPIQEEELKQVGSPPSKRIVRT